MIPNVTGVHVPLSGTSSFTAYVAIKQGRPGEAKHVIPIVLGVDHYLKLVIVVDDDIDVFDESDVMWAVATRMQADRDLVTDRRQPRARCSIRAPTSAASPPSSASTPPGRSASPSPTSW